MAEITAPPSASDLPAHDPTEPRPCPRCGTMMKVLWFLDCSPDGWVCSHCHLYFGDSDRPLAHVI